MRKPKNLKRLKIYGVDGLGGFEQIAPYVDCFAEDRPLRVELDGKYGIQDLEWILAKMKKIKSKGKSRNEIIAERNESECDEGYKRGA